jgi:hypothetical protein
MKDREEGEVFANSAFFPTDWTTAENDELFQVLDDLYERARRIALNIDKKVSDINSILDRL